MKEEYKKCEEINQLTPEMLKNWNNQLEGDIYLVKRQIFFRCPKTGALVEEEICHNCPHNFGNSSQSRIYCMPNTEKTIGARTKRKKEIKIHV